MAPLPAVGLGDSISDVSKLRDIIKDLETEVLLLKGQNVSLLKQGSSAISPSVTGSYNM